MSIPVLRPADSEEEEALKAALEAQERMNALQAEYLHYVQVRADAIRALRRTHSQAQIGGVLGISKQAVANAGKGILSANGKGA